MCKSSLPWFHHGTFLLKSDEQLVLNQAHKTPLLLVFYFAYDITEREVALHCITGSILMHSQDVWFVIDETLFVSVMCFEQSCCYTRFTI